MRVEVLVIGGGATGAGTARDLAMRGFDVLLLERRDFCAGASGANHGMLHSGARYVSKDKESAIECASESKVLRRIAPHCIEDTGGLFVRLAEEDASYADSFSERCRSAGVSASHLTSRELRELEPELASTVSDGYSVMDGSIDPFRLVLSNIESAREAGATVRNYCTVKAMAIDECRITRVQMEDRRNGAKTWIDPEIVVNTAGAWADKVAEMAGCHLDMTRDYGAMVVYNGRLVDRLINRLRAPSDGDIIVPNHTAMIVGTTSRKVADPDLAVPDRQELVRLRSEAEQVLPAMRDCRLVRVYGGARPLASACAGRDASRTCSIIDHSDQGVENLLSVVGGKLTTYRAMAQSASDKVEERLGPRSPCRTSLEPLPSPEKIPGGLLDHQRRSLLRRYGGMPIRDTGPLHGAKTSCSCEQVMRFELDHFARSDDVLGVADLMRRTRAGMGYCQSLDCVWEMLSALAENGKWNEGALQDFLAERDKGLLPLLSGDQLRQEIFRAHLLPTTPGGEAK
ncbi:MAG: sn-glycerol-3-phosphate dehydrogenase subunit A [Methanomassiliicoccales archaeon PtaU1.Bin124]|nr:MAG: sn-glycerol-3-phosphate dehydrogenase subunit A [Methanomassiliicoccales archaeon PtaU1.Bin124]